MSVLSLPRIYFKGSSFWSPDTANNESANYNEANNEVNLQPGVTYETYKQYMMEYVVNQQDPSQSNIRSNNWDFYGDHSCSFVSDRSKAVYGNYGNNVTITGGLLADETYTTADPLCGKGIQILGNKFNDRRTFGRLVDVDPYAYWSSQIFFADLEIGDETTGILGSRHRRMYSYWVGVSRNLDPDLKIAGSTGAVWQTAIPFDQLTIANDSDSQLLAQLQAAMQEPGALGLMIRFSTHITLYYPTINPKDPNDIAGNSKILSEKYLSGEVLANPAYSYTVGSIGVWKEGELAAAPGGRYLMPGSPVVVLDALLEGVSQQNATVTLGPLLAELDESRRTLSLDAIGTFPGYKQSGAIADLGSLVIKAGETEIATLDYEQYNQSAYERNGGIIDIPNLTSAQISAIQSESLQLWLSRSSKGLIGQLYALVRESVNGISRSVMALEEQNLTALSDNRGIYIEQDEPVTCTVQVRDRGGIPASGIRLAVAQYDNNWNYVPPNSESRCLDLPAVPIVEVNPQGLATVTLTPVKSGCCNLLFLPFSGATPPKPPASVQPAYSDFSIIRVMPFDNHLGNPSITPDSQLTWEFMYDNIFRVYDLVYPVMSEIIAMNNRHLLEGAWMQIKAVIGDPYLPHEEDPMWQSTMYMSITRDLSKGKRQLLDRWCNLVSRGNQP